MDDLCEHETFRSICGICHRDNIITRLTAERNALAEDRDGYVQLLTDQNNRLTAEVEKLRAALSPFASTKADDGYDYISGLPDMVIIRIEASVREIKAARAALDEK